MQHLCIIQSLSIMQLLLCIIQKRQSITLRLPITQKLQSTMQQLHTMLWPHTTPKSLPKLIITPPRHTTRPRTWRLKLHTRANLTKLAISRRKSITHLATTWIQLTIT